MVSQSVQELLKKLEAPEKTVKGKVARPLTRQEMIAEEAAYNKRFHSVKKDLRSLKILVVEPKIKKPNHELALKELERLRPNARLFFLQLEKKKEEKWVGPMQTYSYKLFSKGGKLISDYTLLDVPYLEEYLRGYDIYEVFSLIDIYKANKKMHDQYFMHLRLNVYRDGWVSAQGIHNNEFWKPNYSFSRPDWWEWDKEGRFLEDSETYESAELPEYEVLRDMHTRSTPWPDPIQLRGEYSRIVDAEGINPKEFIRFNRNSFFKGSIEPNGVRVAKALLNYYIRDYSSLLTSAELAGVFQDDYQLEQLVELVIKYSEAPVCLIGLEVLKIQVRTPDLKSYTLIDEYDDNGDEGVPKTFSPKFKEREQVFVYSEKRYPLKAGDNNGKS